MEKTINIRGTQLFYTVEGEGMPVILMHGWGCNHSTLKSIEKAILASDLGITPQNDGKVIRLMFPQPTEERRREMTKQVSKMGEDVKVAVRNIRREAVDAAKSAKKDGEMTEDEQKQSEKLIQELTDKYIKEIDKVTDAKSAEIMQF